MDESLFQGRPVLTRMDKISQPPLQSGHLKSESWECHISQMKKLALSPVFIFAKCRIGRNFSLKIIILDYQ